MPMDRDERHQFFGVLAVAAAFFIGFFGAYIVNAVIHPYETLHHDMAVNLGAFVEGTTIGCFLAIVTLFVALRMYWGSRRKKPPESN